MRNIEHIIACARAAHEVNRAYSAALGDTSQPPWELLSDEMRQSSYAGVVSVLDGKGPRELHELWMKTRTSAGWTYGETKSTELRTHPCLVPYDELPEPQRRKDDLFMTTVQNVAGALDLS